MSRLYLCPDCSSGHNDIERLQSHRVTYHKLPLYLVLMLQIMIYLNVKKKKGSNRHNAMDSLEWSHCLQATARMLTEKGRAQSHS